MQSVVPKAARPAAPIVAAAVLATRLPVLLLGALAVAIVGTVPPPAAEAIWRVSSNEVANLLARWDTFFYYTIATDGYHWDPAVFRHYNVVFFPFYALLMRWGGIVLGGHPLIAGLIVSLAAFSAALVVLYRLALLELGEDYAWRVILLISTFPYALYFSVVYTESLFLFLSVSAFYAMRRGKPGWVAICGFAAGLTRPNGFWLALPLACLALWPASSREREFPVEGLSADAETSEPRSSSVGAAWIDLIVSAAPVVGLSLFCAYLFWKFGDPIAWVHGQAAWGVPMLLRAGAPDPGKLPGEPLIKPIEVIVWTGNIIVFCAAVYAIPSIAKRFGIAYAAWMAVNLFPPVVAHLFISIGRFTSVLFPFFFWLALRIPRDKLARVAGLFAACQAVLAVWFFLWRPVV